MLLFLLCTSSRTKIQENIETNVSSMPSKTAASTPSTTINFEFDPGKITDYPDFPIGPISVRTYTNSQVNISNGFSALVLNNTVGKYIVYGLMSLAIIIFVAFIVSLLASRGGIEEMNNGDGIQTEDLIKEIEGNEEMQESLSDSFSYDSYSI